MARFLLSRAGPPSPHLPPGPLERSVLCVRLLDRRRRRHLDLASHLRELGVARDTKRSNIAAWRSRIDSSSWPRSVHCAPPGEPRRRTRRRWPPARRPARRPPPRACAAAVGDGHGLGAAGRRWWPRRLGPPPATRRSPAAPQQRAARRAGVGLDEREDLRRTRVAPAARRRRARRCAVCDAAATSAAVAAARRGARRGTIEDWRAPARDHLAAARAPWSRRATLQRRRVERGARGSRRLFGHREARLLIRLTSASPRYSYRRAHEQQTLQTARCEERRCEAAMRRVPATNLQWSLIARRSTPWSAASSRSSPRRSRPRRPRGGLRGTRRRAAAVRLVGHRLGALSVAGRGWLRQARVFGAAAARRGGLARAQR